MGEPGPNPSSTPGEECALGQITSLLWTLVFLSCMVDPGPVRLPRAYVGGVLCPVPGTQQALSQGNGVVPADAVCGQGRSHDRGRNRQIVYLLALNVHHTSVREIFLSPLKISWELVRSRGLLKCAAALRADLRRQSMSTEWTQC